MAFVVLHPQLVSSWKGRHNDFTEELKAHAKERLPGFARPEWVEIVPELPVSLFLNTCNECISQLILGFTEDINWEDFENRITKNCSETLDASYFLNRITYLVVWRKKLHSHLNLKPCIWSRDQLFLHVDVYTMPYNQMR
jgi:hypothetical protein